MKTIVLSAAVLALGSGCADMAIGGQVTDAGGQPLEGVMVTAVGTICNDQTNAQGQFSLTCEPGSHTLVISKEGYLSGQFEVEAPIRQRYQTEPQSLVKIPGQKGLFLISENIYQPLQDARLRKLETDGVTKTRAFCLDTARSQPDRLPGGVVSLFDNDAPSWKPFRLDAEGCAWRVARNASGHWVQEDLDKPSFEHHKLTEQMKITRLTLSSGDYFIADWQGYFVAAKDDKTSYTGHWLKIAD